ncbi:hypothetical protein EYZ11_013448 [Aspergillus tanneri]|uniref:Rhodopsin domain-containing protein n=1 Tax=Aspergillus tanneri TaxID=1220188 RepID=A0A4S3IZS4_9EURO|nr:hypothetical protein EYZ11_013448 [Aspergillus tanneri]
MRNPSAYVVSPSDQRGLVVITATMFMSWMVIVSLIRLYMRLALNGPFGWDDLAAFLGAILGIAHVGTIMHGVSQGLGRMQGAIVTPQSMAAGKALYAANLLFLAGHCAAKLSVIFLLQRLGREKLYLWWCKIALLVTSVWALASILANIAWKVITGVDVITEALLVSISIYLVWGIRMQWKQKATVIFAFGTRLSLMAIAICRQIYLNDAFSHTDLSLDLSDSLVVTEVLLHCSIMAATVPCLKPFVIAFNTGWGQGIRRNGDPYYGASTSASQPQSHSRRDKTLNPMVSREPVPRESEGSDNSQRMIIQETREWTLQTEYIEMETRG